MPIDNMDAIHAWQWGDDAVWGFGVMAAGAMLGGIAPFFSGSSALFDLNPFSLAALVLIVLGAGLVFWLSSTQLEDWLECGPFGTEPRDYLANDTQEAFYRLVSIFAGIRIAIEPNPYFNPNAKLDRNQESDAYRLASANTRIRIGSNLPGLLAQMGEVGLYADTRLCISEVNYLNGGEYQPAPIITLQNPAPVAQRFLPGGRELYMNTPADRSWTDNNLSSHFQSYSWRVRAQWRMALDNGDKVCRPGDRFWLFPAPPIRNGKAEPTQAPAISFYKNDIPFWADEETHAES